MMRAAGGIKPGFVHIRVEIQPFRDAASAGIVDQPRKCQRQAAQDHAVDRRAPDVKEEDS